MVVAVGTWILGLLWILELGIWSFDQRSRDMQPRLLSTLTNGHSFRSQ
jgi:hypothetical protein